jgi:glycosyltransferase involved in cell wall biosynthesis
VRILYDATPLLLRSAGVKNYHHALLVRLAARLRPHQLALYPFLHTVGRNRNEGSNFARVPTAWRLGALLASNYLRLPVPSLAARGADLFHITHHLLHPPAHLKLTSFIHDLTPLLMPELHTASNVRYFRHFAERIVPRLAGIIVPSQAVKRDLLEHLRVPEERVTVIPHGVDEDFFPMGGQEPKRRAYDLPDQYILFLGSLEPRKNLPTALESWRLLPVELRRDHPLVVAGASGWKNRAIRAQLRKAQTEGVRLIGYVEPHALPLVYANAAAFLFPSLYEGFGMPLLEAMAAGAPIVASQTSSLPEVVGDAGLLVDPRSPSEIAQALEQVLTNRDLAAALVAKGRARARQFTWDKSADQTKAFFERV